MKVKRIRLSARFQVDDHSKVRVEQADFALGPGPCGKVVTGLHFKEQGGFAIIQQETSDGETKQFAYTQAQLTGRIEVTYGS